MGGNGGERNLHSATSFTTTGNRKNHKVKFETDMVYSFQHKKIRTKSRPWFMPACEKVAKDCQKIFVSEMRKLGM
jgi:hypothetical protein